MGTDNKLLTLVLFLVLIMIYWSIACSADQVEPAENGQPEVPIRGAPVSERVGLGTRYDAEAIIAAVLRRQIAGVEDAAPRIERQWKIPGTLRGQAAPMAPMRPEPVQEPASSAPQQPQQKRVNIGNQAMEQRLNLTRREKQAIQAVLTDRGFDTEGIDGIFGNNTRAAIRRFQQAERLPDTGYLNASQLELLIQ